MRKLRYALLASAFALAFAGPVQAQPYYGPGMIGRYGGDGGPGMKGGGYDPGMMVGTAPAPVPWIPG